MGRAALLGVSGVLSQTAINSIGVTIATDMGDYLRNPLNIYHQLLITYTAVRDRWQAVYTKWTLPNRKKRHRI